MSKQEVQIRILKEQVRSLKGRLKMAEAIAKALVPVYYVRRAWKWGVAGGLALGFIFASIIWSLI